MNSRVVTAFVLNSCVSVKSAWKGQRSNSSCLQISPALWRRNLLLLQDNHCEVWLTVVIFFLVSIKSAVRVSRASCVLWKRRTLYLFILCFFVHKVRSESSVNRPRKMKMKADLTAPLCYSSNHCCINVLGLLKNIQSHLDLIGRSEH